MSVSDIKWVKKLPRCMNADRPCEPAGLGHRIASIADPHSAVLPPVGCCLETDPSQAARSRAFQSVEQTVRQFTHHCSQPVGEHFRPIPDGKLRVSPCYDDKIRRPASSSMSLT